MLPLPHQQNPALLQTGILTQQADEPNVVADPGSTQGAVYSKAQRAEARGLSGRELDWGSWAASPYELWVCQVLTRYKLPSVVWGRVAAQYMILLLLKYGSIVLL